MPTSLVLYIRVCMYNSCSAVKCTAIIDSHVD